MPRRPAYLQLAGPPRPAPGELGAALRSRMHIDARQGVWLGTFVSLCAYLLNQKFGTAAAALSIGFWVLYAAAYPRRVLSWMGEAWLVWSFPCVAIASVLWSIEPGISQRLSIELALFTGVGVMMARIQTARSFISALMSALILCVGLSMVFGEKVAVGLTGEIADIGLFGSKNYFAFVTCLMMMTSCAVGADRLHSRSTRVLAAFGLLAGPAVLIKAHSLGALVAAFVGCAALTSVLLYSSVSPRWRGAFLAILMGFGVAVAVFAAYAVSQGLDIDTLLTSLGKDPGLTGRTFLWARAESFIRENPLFGLGYQAFWVQGHVEAEGLWRYADIDSRAGFHFHNLFFATAVELGYTGVAALGIEIFATVIAVSVWALRRPGPESAFFFALFLFYLTRMSVELDFLAPFSYGTLTLPIAWVYGTRAVAEARRSATQRRSIPGTPGDRPAPDRPAPDRPISGRPIGDRQIADTSSSERQTA